MRPLFRVFLIASITAACTQAGDDYGVPVDQEDSPPPVHLEGAVEVTRVIDGDTIEVVLPAGKTFVRMKGINTPEMHPDGATTPQPFAPQAREYTLAHVGSEVTLEFNSDCASDPLARCRDIYDRLLAYVRLAGGEDIGLLLLEQGLARVYRYNNGTVPGFDRQTEYVAAETQAKSQALGVWSE